MPGAAAAPARTQSGRPAIVTDANIQLLFDMQVGLRGCLSKLTPLLVRSQEVLSSLVSLPISES